MICMAVDKQRLWYANPTGEQTPIYERDSETDEIIYDDVDGELVPRESGKWETLYSLPVKFYGNINAGDIGRSEFRAYGISMGDFEAKLVMHKGDIPIDEQSIIWYMTAPRFKAADGSKTRYILKGDTVYKEVDGELVEATEDEYRVDPQSADYRVKRVPPCLDEIDYLLSRNDNNGAETT